MQGRVSAPAWGRWEVLDAPPPEAEGWIAPEAAAHGMVRDSLSARIDPPAYLAALASCLGCALSEGAEARLRPDEPAVVLQDGTLRARNVVVAAGWRAWEMLAPGSPHLAGTAVKGQAGLLAAVPGDRPLITAPGLYIVPHRRGVAVGSTNEPRFAEAIATDGRLDALIERARAVCPVLARARVIGRWAGLRPKPPGRLPVVGPLPGRPWAWIAGGGYRIGIGIAHAIADALVAEIIGAKPPIQLPDAFRPPSG